MKNFVILVLLVGTITFAYFQFPQVRRLVYYSPCDTPIQYKIGTIDSKFNLSQSELKTDLDEAGKVWSKAEGKNLFIFDPQADLSVNMVYDERQYLSSKLDQLGNSVQKIGNTVDNMESTLSSKQKTLNQEVTEFQQQVKDFNTKFDQYQKDVEFWNSKGGAPAEFYQQLKQTQQDLITQQQSLSQQESKIKQETANYNGDVDALNKTISDYNQKIGTLKDTANSLNQTISLHPEEGVYDGGTQTIDIYYNISHAELVHTLAHEMGHSLGMEHNNNKDSIMYSYTTKAATPSADDLVGLNQVCMKRTPLNVIWDRVYNKLKSSNNK